MWGRCLPGTKAAPKLWVPLWGSRGISGVYSQGVGLHKTAPKIPFPNPHPSLYLPLLGPRSIELIKGEWGLTKFNYGRT